MKLLTRDEFRESVFTRDKNKCVFCDKAAVDAHHILERRLWNDGGYYLSNGASVCAEHHMKCETTEISVEQVREACGITKFQLPEHMYESHTYDKWGNIILDNGMRMKGELFNDESVQKVLKIGGVLSLFTNYVKYPRTYHVPWSPGMHDDDRMHKNMELFVGKRVIVTEKMDGENTSMYSDYMHARSIDGRSHPSRSWAKSIHATIAQDIPEGWRICCENVYAEHSIKYDSLESYVYGFSIWDQNNVCLSWDQTKEWFSLLGITPVKVLYDGIYDEAIIKKLWDESQWETVEGYVLRTAESFPYKDFNKCVGKFVRKGHVQTAKHWKYGKPLVPNGLATSI